MATLPQNSPVMVDDVTVGSVSGIEARQKPDGSFFAAVKVSLKAASTSPATRRPRWLRRRCSVRNTSTSPPPVDQAAQGKLHDGSNIPLDRAGRYPTTEEVLSSLGVVVNKGNLGALQDITDETYAAVAGRSGQFIDLIPRLAELTTSLDQQTGDIVAALDGLNRFASILAKGKDSLGRTLDSLPAALKVLNDNRSNIVDAFTALRTFAGVASHVLSETKADFVADFKDLYPVIKALNDNADDFIKDLEFLPTFPFHYKYLRNAVRGDYLNVFVTFDLTVRRFGDSVFTTSKGLDPNMKHLDEVVNPPDFLTGAMSNLSGQAADPFKIPPGTATQHDRGTP